MKRIHLILGILLCFNLSFSLAQISINKKQLIEAQHYLNKKGEVYFSFDIKERSEILTLTKIISIDNVKLHKVFAYANKKEFAKFLLLGYKFTVLPHPGDVVNPKMKTSATIKNIELWDAYPTYAVYESMMYQFTTNFPNLCKLDTIGVLASGRKLLAVKISDNVNQKENEPRFLYSSSMHGDEVTGYVLMLRMIDFLLNNYGSNTEVTNLVNNIEIWICPLANPDGTYKGGNSTVSGSVRYNANNVDLNRNYPDPSAGQHPDGNVWQPETQFFMNFAQKNHFNMAANFHGGAEVVNYPWDSFQQLAADDNWWQYVSSEYADTVHLHSTGYMTDLNNGITNGYAWYLVNGGRQDYMNYWQYCREMTIELSALKILTATDLPAHWDYNYRSLIGFIQQSLNGVRGVVTDSCTGQPIEAKVEIIGHDMDNSFVQSFLPVGDYHRYLYSGNYTLTYSASGYEPKSYAVNVANDSAVVRDVQLATISPVAEFSADNITSCSGIINFTDLSSSSTNTWLWNFGDGTQSTEKNPTHTYTSNGTYTVSLTAQNCSGSTTIVKNSFITIDAPAAPAVTPNARCGSGTVNLSASGSGTLKWFDAPSSGNLVYTGTSYTTPVISATTSYYVEDLVPGAVQHVGEPDSALGTGSFYTQNTNHYLTFNCQKDLFLKSVLVYTNSTKMRHFQIKDKLGNFIFDTTYTVTTGASRVPVNIQIPADTGYKFLCETNNPQLYRNTATTAFPYTISNLISITRSSAVSGNNYVYYYFYDWQVSELPCLSPRAVVVATIVNPPTVNFTSYTTCVSQPVTFTDTSVPSFGDQITGWSWSFGDGGNSSLQNPTHTFSALGSYTVTLTVTTASGCSNTYSNTVQVVNSALQPQSFLLVSPAMAAVLTTGAVNFLWNASTNASHYIVEIASNSSFTNAFKIPLGNVTNINSVSLTNCKSYYWRVVAYNACSDSVVSAYQVFQLGITPNAAFSANTVCAGTNTTFTDLSTINGDVLSFWHWDFGTAAVSTVQNPQYTYALGGSYNATLIVQSQSGCADTLVQAVQVKNAPAIPTITQQSDSLISSAASGNQWYDANGIVSGQTGNSFHPTVSGFYSVQVSNAEACATSSVLFNYVYIGISAITSVSKMTISPNPAKDAVIIKTTESLKKIRIINTIGAVVYEKQYQSSNVITSQYIDLKGFSKGLYFVEVRIKNNLFTERLVVAE